MSARTVREKTAKLAGSDNVGIMAALRDRRGQFAKTAIAILARQTLRCAGAGGGRRAAQRRLVIVACAQKDVVRWLDGYWERERMNFSVRTFADYVNTVLLADIGRDNKAYVPGTRVSETTCWRWLIRLGYHVVTLRKGWNSHQRGNWKFMLKSTVIPLHVHNMVHALVSPFPPRTRVVYSGAWSAPAACNWPRDCGAPYSRARRARGDP